jgi:hypothetical protein
MALSSLYKDSEAIPVGTFLEMLEAGEMFEGMHGFSVPALLEKMGLTGKERRSEIVKPVSASSDTNQRLYVENTMEEAIGMALEGEPSEPSVEASES